MPAQNTFSFWIEIEHVYLTPTDKIRATWSSFFGRRKLRFAHMTEKISNYDNDGCNGYFDDNDD